MKIMLSIYVSLYFMSILSYSIQKKYVFVATHFRHGARAPLDLNPKTFLDHQKQKWTIPGELTGVGQRMHYILGLRNRQRYIVDNKFLSEKFDPHEIKIYSTNVNRTIVSALAQFQGLYPITRNKGTGDELSNKMQENAIPPVDISNKEVKSLITDLKNYSLPYKMSIFPTHIFDDNARLIRTFEVTPCAKKEEEYKEKNLKSEKIEKVKNTFNDKFGLIFNKFYGDEEKKQYDFFFIGSICDAFYSGMSEGRDLEILKTGINKTDLEIECENVFRATIQYYVFGDSEKNMATIEGSKMFRRLIELMKYRIDADINGTKIEDDYLEYNKPKYVMLSGHDSTLGGMQIFLMKAFGIPDEEYITPTFASQIAIEVYLNEGSTSNSDITYDDYMVDYLFNDKVVKSLNFTEFMRIIEKSSWSAEKIDDFCGLKSTSDKIIYIIIIAVLAVIILIFIAILIYAYLKIRSLLKVKELGKLVPNDVV